MNFLFWNTGGFDRGSIINRLVLIHAVDVVVLAEYPGAPEALARELNLGTGLQFTFTPSTCDRIVILVNFDPGEIDRVTDAERFTIRRVSRAKKPDILLAAAHLPSKREWSHESQYAEMIEFAKTIRHAEARIGHSRTVVVGDLNMNPFEPGMVAASGLHAVMTRSIALKEERVVQSQRHPYFYNPMWGRFGDTTKGPPGTYYHRRSEQVSYFWHMFDQVLVRPGLLPYFQPEEMEVLTTAGPTSFLSSSGKPDPRVASDHLPLLFRLNL
jgi:hypothetical protein